MIRASLNRNGMSTIQPVGLLTRAIIVRTAALSQACGLVACRSLRGMCVPVVRFTQLRSWTHKKKTQVA